MLVYQRVAKRQTADKPSLETIPFSFGHIILNHFLRWRASLSLSPWCGCTSSNTGEWLWMRIWRVSWTWTRIRWPWKSLTSTVRWLGCSRGPCGPEKIGETVGFVGVSMGIFIQLYTGNLGVRIARAYYEGGWDDHWMIKVEPGT